ncbi:hypothetical protein HNR61_009204, partial [Actinomadura namibiensis]|nr:hypothetical protein [Actinomadura namibiensis]
MKPGVSTTRGRLVTTPDLEELKEAHAPPTIEEMADAIMRKGPAGNGGAFPNMSPAASYSPTQSPMQYH